MGVLVDLMRFWADCLWCSDCFWLVDDGLVCLGVCTQVGCFVSFGFCWFRFVVYVCSFVWL